MSATTCRQNQMQQLSGSNLFPCKTYHNRNALMAFRFFYAGLWGRRWHFPFRGQAATFPIRGRLVGQAMAFPFPGQAEDFLQLTGHRRTSLTPLRKGAMWQVRQFCPTCHITPLHKTTEEGHVWPVNCRNYITHKIQQFKYLHYKKKDLTLLAEQP